MRSTLDLRIFVWTITSAHVVFQIAPCAVIAQGPLPPGFTYQGHVKNGGSPVNGTADFEFSLWNSYFFSNPENQIGTTMSISNVAVSNGLFMVTVNSGNEFGPTPFNGDARWLQIAVRSPAGSGSFTTLSPRQQLLTVPYASYATLPWASLAGNLTYTSPGNVGIGTYTPTEKLDVAGSIAIRDGELKGYSNGVFQTLTSDVGAYGTLSFWKTGDLNASAMIAHSNFPARALALSTGDGTGGLAERLVIHPNGNVGVGTNNPLTNLHVRSSLDTGASLAIDARAIMADKRTTLEFQENGSSIWGLGKDTTNQFYLDESGTGRRLTVQSGTGNVGIGTSNPGAKLDVQGQVQIVDGTQGAGKVLTSDVGGLASWQNPSSPYWSANGNNISNTNSGNVGIGTATPSAKLHIQGTVKIADGTQGAGRVLTSDANGAATWQTPITQACCFTNIQMFNASGSFTVPAGIIKIMVEVRGGGGGGGGITGSGQGASGGGGGGYGMGFFDVVPGNVYTITVGAAGSAGNPNGGPGGTSSFGALIQATGGAAATALNGGTGGTSNGALNMSGHPGERGVYDGISNLAAGAGGYCGDGSSRGSGGSGSVSGSGSPGTAGQIVVRW